VSGEGVTETADCSDPFSASVGRMVVDVVAALHAPSAAAVHLDSDQTGLRPPALRFRSSAATEPRVARYLALGGPWRCQHTFTGSGEGRHISRDAYRMQNIVM
jgi:hypothetical protein